MKETGETWGWFLSLLKLEFKIERDYEWTFMSDKQKGFIQAMREVFPNAEHRFCVRHMHANFRNAGFRGQAFKHAMWECARASTVNEFDRKMKELRELDENAYQWFNDKTPTQWSRSHFQEFPKCDMLLNNGCESFNSVILEAREKPLISMLEWILEYLMQRMQTNRDRAQEKWKGILCPKIEKIIEKTSKKVGDCLPIKADAFHYQISCFDALGTKYSVDLKNHTCGCRKWELSGIPCNHALCAIYTQMLDYHDFTHPYYSVETYKKVYAPVIIPINGRREWQASNYISPLPPIFERSVGRPKKARCRESDEQPQKRRKRNKGKPQLIENANKMKRQQHTLKCSRCGAEGHNKRTCPPTGIVRRKSSLHKDVLIGQSSSSFDMLNVFGDASTAVTMNKTSISSQIETEIMNAYTPNNFSFRGHSNSANDVVPPPSILQFTLVLNLHL
ncbi:uncharacterized protein [Henckelia pumila]|uniref:uncharacterized protein n=1 Tax=Henckelia pumila TaxID=405737 RepID=UPI003C6E05B9